jgi:DNA repair protein RadC
VKPYHEKISLKAWAEQDRAREKLTAFAFTDAEQIAILIGSASRAVSVVELSERILRHYDNDLTKLAKASIQQLFNFRGTGGAKAISIIAARETGRRTNHLIISDNGYFSFGDETLL